VSKVRIVRAAIALARVHGYEKVTREQIAKRLKCASGLINYHCTTMERLRGEIVREAIRISDGAVLAQALVGKHALALAMSEQLKALARASIG